MRQVRIEGWQSRGSGSDRRAETKKKSFAHLLGQNECVERKDKRLRHPVLGISEAHGLVEIACQEVL